MMKEKPKTASSGAVKKFLLRAVSALGLTLAIIGVTFLTICFDLRSFKSAASVVTAKENVGNVTFVMGAILAFTVAVYVYYKLDVRTYIGKQNNAVLLPPDNNRVDNMLLFRFRNKRVSQTVRAVLDAVDIFNR